MYQNYNKKEAIAIIGIGCRFPGGSNNPTAFWDLLINGRDAVIDVPKERWDVRRFYDANQDKPGKMYIRSGGFLQERIDQFDALFFGISPREAACLDPQQRILLEVAWEAFEDAGLIPNQLAGSDTAVYIGGFMLDHLMTQTGNLARHLIGPHTAVSFTHTMLSNRLSYVFDFKGPSMTIDTACSSSLVALHEACQSLWRYESSLALAGGVNIMHRPESPIVMCKGKLLSPDGRSKSFDERADGYGRGEGAGIVVLKPLSAALKDGDEIYALIRATGVNQDGRTSSITVPNPEAQEKLIRQVCSNADVAPQQICYVEAHGTGTAVGDPLECQAINSALGVDRSVYNPCLIGSVKSNIGHLESAAGIASVIKSALCLQHGKIPPVANLKKINNKISFENLRFPLRAENIPKNVLPTVVGINSFGYGGTNAHAILEEAPKKSEKYFEEEIPGTPSLLLLSARSKKALTSLAQSYSEFISKVNAPSLRDICYSAAIRREHHSCRLALVADAKQDMLEQLRSFASGQSDHLSIEPVIPEHKVKPAFVFTGMGPQWWKMGQELLLHESVFRRMAEECDAIFQNIAGWSILAEMKADENHSKMNETQVAQPANFVLQAALTALLRDRGIEPAAVVGHSVGEVTAAYVSGMLDLENAIRVSYHRSRVQKKAAGQGKMLAVGLSSAEAQTLLAGHEDKVSFAAINSPSTVTLSGDSQSLETIAAALEAKGVFNRFLRVEMAYHSPVMEPLKKELRESLSMLLPKNPAIPFYSTVSGQLVTQSLADAEYWCNNIRQPVLFARAIENLIADGYQLFIEIGPHPVLSSAIKECLTHQGARGTVVASLHRKESEQLALLKAIGSLYVLNSPVDFTQCYKRANYVRLPTYPWQRETCWNESEESIYDRVGCPEHFLIGTAIKRIPSIKHICWENSLNSNFLPYMTDHRIEGLVVLPGAAYVEIGLAVCNNLQKKDFCALEEIQFHRALVIDSDDDPVIHVNYDKETHEYSVYSCYPNKKYDWTLHATGKISQLKIGKASQINLDDIRIRCQTPIDADIVYMQLSKRGLQYGPYFRGVRRLWIGTGEVLAQIEGKETVFTADAGLCHLHPTLLDACFQSLLFIDNKEDNTTYLPVGIRQIRLYSQPDRNLWCYGRKIKRTHKTIEADVILCDNEGNVFAEARGVLAQSLNTQQVSNVEEKWKNLLYEFLWEKEEKEEKAAVQPKRWLIFLDQNGIGENLVAKLHAAGAIEVVSILPGISFQQNDDTHFRARRDSKEDMLRLMKAISIGEGWRVVYLWGMEVPTADDSIGTVESLCFLHLIQALASTVDRLESFHFFLVTCGAQPVSSALSSLAQAPLVGLTRVAINEHPNIHFHLVDIDPDQNADDLLLEELMTNSKDEEIALRGTDRFVHRFRQIPVGEPELTPVAADSSFKLQNSRSSGIQFREVERKVPDPQEIEIEIHAVSLAKETALRMKSRDFEVVQEDTSRSHFETVSGVVNKVGKNVQAWHPGKEVVAFAPAIFRSHATLSVDSMFLLPKPDSMSHAECVGLLLPFVTAYYGLHSVAKLQPGEKVLIYGAASGIGLAAVQVAQRLGGEIFAAVDSEKQQNHLASLKIKHVFDSRSLDFADLIMSSADGKGVDVIIYVSSSEAVQDNCSIINSFGRVIEIGSSQGIKNKRSFHMPSSRNVSVAVADIDCLLVERPELFKKLIHEVWEMILAGKFVSLPATSFPAAQITDAVEYATNSDRVGDIVISMRNQQTALTLPMMVKKKLFRSDSTYLITGGFGGFGMEAAKWMAKSGCKNLVLVGRNGAATEEARRTVEELERDGVKVFAAAADIAQEPQVDKLMQDIAAAMPPLKGIFHAAAVLDDAPMLELNEQQYSRVMAPKALGAWLLHQRTLNMSIDFFVLFSSIASQVGSPGQGNYVAANTFLDALAHYRRAKGLPATSINWGALSEVGMAARHEETKKYLDRMGIKAISPLIALRGLTHILFLHPVQCSIVDADWQQLGEVNPIFASSPRFSSLLKSKRKMEADAHFNISKGNLEFEQILQFLLKALSKILQLSIEKIDTKESLINIGLDSLLSIELQVSINKNFSVQISPLELMKGITIQQLAEYIEKNINNTKK